MSVVGVDKLSATHCLLRVLSDLFLGQCHHLVPASIGLHLIFTEKFKPLSATIIGALLRFNSRLNIKICKLLSLKLQIKPIRVVFCHLKLWVKVVRHGTNLIV